MITIKRVLHILVVGTLFCFSCKQRNASALATKEIVQTKSNDDHIRIYKRLFGTHLRINDHVTFHPEAGYYSSGMGYYRGGHDLVVNQEELKKGSIAPEIAQLPDFIMYQILKNYHRLNPSSAQSVRAQDNLYLTRHPAFAYLKKHYAINRTYENLQAQDIVLMRGDTRWIAATEEGVTCTITHDTILQVESVTAEGVATLKSSVLLPLQGMLPSYEKATCRSGQRLIIPSTQLIAENKRFFVTALQVLTDFRQNILPRIINQPHYTRLYPTTDISFCGGSKDGFFRRFADYAANTGQLAMSVVDSDGSIDNLIKLNDRICNAGLIQEDALEVAVESQMSPKVFKEEVFSESMYLVCHKDVSKKNLADFSGSDHLLVGSKNSGSALTFTKLSRRYPSLKQVRVDHHGGKDALTRIFGNKSAAKCLFFVSHKDAPLLKFIDAYPQLKFLNISFQHDNDQRYQKNTIKAVDFPHLTNGTDIQTLLVKTFLVVRENMKESALGQKNFDQLLKAVRKTRADFEKGMFINQRSAMGKVAICSGGDTSFYSSVVSLYKQRTRSMDLENIYTTGSIDSILKVVKGDCDIALVQSDVGTAALADANVNPHIIADTTELFSEYGWLMCRRDAKINNLRELDDWRDLVSVGPPRSGSAFTWRQIMKRYAHLRKRPQHDSYRDGLRKLLDGSISCLFSVSAVKPTINPPYLLEYATLTGEASYTGILNHPYKEASMVFKSGRKLSTFSVGTILLISKKFYQDHKTRVDHVRKGIIDLVQSVKEQR